MNLAHLLGTAGRCHGAAPALALGRTTLLSYAELAARVAALAGQLRRHDRLVAGDRVALAMKNRPEYVELLFAIWHAGLVAVPMNAKLHGCEFAHILEDSAAGLCFADPHLADMLAARRVDCPLVVVGGREYAGLLDGPPAPIHPVAADDLAWLFYTSGTTGRPKGAMLTHRNLMTMTLAYCASVDVIAPGDGLLHAAPMSHGSGMYIIAHVARGGVQIIPESGGFDVAEVFDLLRHHRGVTMFAAPTMVKRLCDHPGAAARDGTGLKTVIYGGGPMYLADLKRAQRLFGDKFVQIYGQGECPMTITAMDKATHRALREAGDDRRLNSAGTAQMPVCVRVVDADGRALPAGETGEVVVCGDAVMRGYWRNDAASTAAIRDGWLFTGDMGWLDARGYLTLSDRSKDLIISGGTNIYPREVEEVLLRHDHLREVAVVGRPDPDWGEVVVAFVVPVSGKQPDPAALDAHCLAHMARFKRPKHYHLVAELPKNHYGKILKTKLREHLERDVPCGSRADRGAPTITGR